MNTPQVTKLDNGLRIITEQVRDVDSVALSIRVGVGSRAESANQNGISHFLEHINSFTFMIRGLAEGVKLFFAFNFRFLWLRFHRHTLARKVHYV